MFYWRDGNNEVDFVLHFKEKTIGIEVKSGSGNTAKGMEAFQKQFSPFRIILVGMEGLPIGQFLKINPADLF